MGGRNDDDTGDFPATVYSAIFSLRFQLFTYNIPSTILAW